MAGIWRSAPLAPAALSLTAGIFLERLARPEPWVVMALAVASAAAALAHFRWRPFWILLLVFAIGAVRGALLVGSMGGNDIASMAGSEHAPIRLRGIVVDAIQATPPPKPDPLRLIPVPARWETVVAVESAWRGGAPSEAEGEVRVAGSGAPPDASPGDRVDIAGQIRLIPGPMNPGETDGRAPWLARGIAAEVRVADNPGALESMGPSGTWDIRVLLAGLRARAAARLAGAIDPEVEPLAAALLLGETSRLSRESWDQYRRTGVVHVLAISGQHLVLLAMFLTVAGRCAGMGARALAWPIALAVAIYAGMTGARPAATRAAATVAALAMADILRRPRHLPSVIAFSWLVVGLLDPGDLFGTGCLLSFLATALLYWAAPGWSEPPTEQEEALARARDMGRSAPWRLVRAFLRAVAIALGTNAVIWCCLTPLVAARTHLVSPSALVVGPPVALLGSLALLPGFPLLILGGDVPLVSPALGWCAGMALKGCAGLVGWAANWPWASFWVGDISLAWLVPWHILLIPALAENGWRARARAGVPAMAWLAAGLAVSLAPPARTDPWRCTFLAVGHGGCAVIEWADGSTTVYDAGSLANAAVGRRIIAPFLWHRGVERVDELILSHADLDHFNGALDLVERVPVGRVLVSGWFARKEVPGVRFMLDGLAARGVPVEEVEPGFSLARGAASLEVLHPAPGFEASSQNEASVVALLRHSSGNVLLTGDLEGAGQRALMKAVPGPGVAVLQSPHHGGAGANGPAFLGWAAPWLTVAQEDSRRARQAPGDRTWSTSVEGAITIRPDGPRLRARGHVTGREADGPPAAAP